jgi:hydrogenase maturation factor HypF (carbamoyltransferase family)
MEISPDIAVCNECLYDIAKTREGMLEWSDWISKNFM